MFLNKHFKKTKTTSIIICTKYIPVLSFVWDKSTIYDINEFQFIYSEMVQYGNHMTDFLYIIYTNM